MKYIVFLTYDGMTDPLGQSQVIPYMKYLVKVGYNFKIISYEKNQNYKIENKVNSLIGENNWVKIKFRRGFFGKIINIILGIVSIKNIAKKNNISFFHLRGFIPALIFNFSKVKINYLYDYRSFAVGEHIDTNNIKENGFLHKLFTKIDKAMVKNSKGIVLLEVYAKRLLCEIYNFDLKTFEIIRTSTSIKNYPKKEKKNFNNEKEILFVSLGGARFPYRSDIILKTIKSLIDNGINCRIDFINQYDHQIIKKHAENIKFPKEKIKIYSLDNELIPNALGKFDYGCVFYEKSKWRTVCSPTKLGEFLSAGLPIIALDGIKIIDKLEKNYDFIFTIKSDVEINLQIKEIIKFISLSHDNNQCQKLALKKFDIQIANKKYERIYKKLFV